MTIESRRTFLKLSGFGLFAACSRGVETKAIPLLVPVEERVPGVASWYASMCAGCAAGCGVLARSRDGSPVKLEGNPEHPVSRGGLCAAGQASVLGLYDSHRLEGPLSMGAESGWAQVDEQVRARLDRVGSGAVRFLTGTVNSPTVLAAIRAFGERFQDFRHVQYDALPASAALDVHEAMFGRRALPRPRFDRADVIVGIDADFLGTWISPVEYARDYRAGRDPDGAAHSHHVQFEGRLSLTGSNADRRHARADLGRVAAELAAAVARRVGAPVPVPAEPSPEVEAVAARLAAAPRGRTLVVCGLEDAGAQALVARTNEMLGNYGATLATDRLSRQRLGREGDVATLREELKAGRVRLLLVAGCNPVYDVPAFDPSQAETVVSFAERKDETASRAQFVCPDHHPLESWGDAEAVDGVVTVGQPTVAPLENTRALVETLARWRGDDRDARALMRETWAREIHPRAGGAEPFETFWARCVHDGFAELPAAPVAKKPVPRSLLAPPADPARGPGEFALALYPTVAMLDGRHAHNPWLHELPDPVTKVVWDNYACLSPRAADGLGVETGDLVDVGGIALPALVQPGQHDEVVAVPVGYGREGTDRFAGVGPEWLEGAPTLAPGELVGRNAAPLRGTPSVTVRKAKGRRELARTQTYDSMTVPEALGGGDRDLAREQTLAEHRDARDAPRSEPRELWPADHRFPGHHWGMAVDLSACNGCSACVVACQAENNVPVVGKDEVLRSREMSWIRIDRYYEGEGDDLRTTHQPMMCQHCDNAPCETVCPVLATVQSSEGLNQQVYNRCVGTRYCANNCPYKVRRFNWFDYPHDDALANNALNPDVVVRMRGVMEKCSFCIQRIYDAKHEARREGRPVRDGDVRPACAQSCPAEAMVFGDLNDPESRVARAWRNRRRYRLLEDLNTRPSVAYLSLVRNRDV